MPKLPIISGDKAVKCFRKIGYIVAHQKGSHIRMQHQFNKEKKPITVPRHKQLGKGLLRKLLRDTELALEEFLKLL